MTNVNIRIDFKFSSAVPSRDEIRAHLVRRTGLAVELVDNGKWGDGYWKASVRAPEFKRTLNFYQMAVDAVAVDDLPTSGWSTKTSWSYLEWAVLDTLREMGGAPSWKPLTIPKYVSLPWSARKWWWKLLG